MPLDPIVSLSVAMAEMPGSCAVLLGAGVSVDAGVPTGWAIFRDGLRRLYRLENQTDQTPEDDAIDAWLAQTGRADLNHSSLLDLIAPDAATRRALVAGYFDGAEPGQSHDVLADLAARGLVRVFITTNFDRLTETALAARGIDAVVVSDDATLAAAPRREHAQVFIIKAHGDYLQETIRNTPQELDGLEPELTAEIRTVLDHYGLLVLGWSGQDPALSRLIRQRHSRYGMWWLSLEDPPAEPGRSLAEAAGARVMIRDGAGELLADLDRRLAVYETYSRGNDPGSVHDEVRTLLRRDDTIALDDLLRRERYEFEAGIESVTADHVQHHDQPEHVADAGGRLLAATQRRLASLIPIALHYPEALRPILAEHAGWASQVQPIGGTTTWQKAWVVPFWVIGRVLGALLLRLSRFAVMRPIFDTTWTDYNNWREPFVGHPETAGALIAEQLGGLAGQNLPFPQWNWLLAEVSTWDWLAERYPDWLLRDGEPARSMAAFDMLLGIAFALEGEDNEGQVALWTLVPTAATTFAQRLFNDRALREAVAGAVGTSLQTFDERAPEIIAGSHGFGMFPRTREVANILRTGRYG